MGTLSILKALWETTEPYKPRWHLTAALSLVGWVSLGLVLPKPNKKPVPARKTLRTTDTYHSPLKEDPDNSLNEN